MEEKLGNKIEKYTSGALFHCHPFFKDNPKALRLILNKDEFEACNPLGSSRGKHKLLAVYFSVGNIDQYHLSSLSSIHLALLCEYPNNGKYGMDQILKPILDDVNTLETEGIRVTTCEGKEHLWKGGLAFICGVSIL